jgi:type I restriction enzyme S subunit
VALTHFNTKSVATMPIPVPPVAEQRRITDKIVELMALCDQIEARSSNAETTRSQLLDALLADALAPVASALQATN